MENFVIAGQTRQIFGTSSPVVSLQENALTELLSRQKYLLVCERFLSTSGWQIEKFRPILLSMSIVKREVSNCRRWRHTFHDLRVVSDWSVLVCFSC